MRMSTLRPLAAPALVAVVLSASGCDLVLGLDKYKEGNATGAAGGASTASSSTGESSTTGTMTSSSSASGSGGSGGMTACSPGMDYGCYDGPAMTENVGECRGGTHTCKADGETYTPCVQQVLPTGETCKDDKKDEDCDHADCVLSAHPFGDAADQTIAGVATDAAGNVFIAGTFKGTLALDPTKPLVATSMDGQIYVAKFSATGAPIWSKTFSSTKAVTVSGLAVDASGAVIFTGTFSPGPGGTLSIGPTPIPTYDASIEGYAGKLDASGNFVFSRDIEHDQVNHPAPPAVDAMGNIYLWSDASCQSSCNNSEFALTKVGPNNALIWFKNSYQSVFTSSTDYTGRVARAVAVDGAGNVYVVGGFKGSEVLGGGTAITAAGGLDGIVGKFNSAGTLLNKWRFGDTTDQIAGPIAIDSSNNAYVVTTFRGSLTLPSGTSLTSKGGSDVGIFQLSSGGVFGWAKSFGDPAEQTASAVATGNGQVLLASTTLGNVDYGGGVLTSAGGTDVSMVKLDAASGFYLWSRLFGDSGIQSAGSVMNVATTGRAIFAATFNGNVDLGGGALASTGANDIVFATIAP